MIGFRPMFVLIANYTNAVLLKSMNVMTNVSMCSWNPCLILLGNVIQGE